MAAFPAITVAELTAGKDITPFLLTDYKVGYEGSNTVTETSVLDTAEINVPTMKKYSGSLHVFRSYLTTGKTGDDDLLLTFAGANETGYFVRRTGPLATQAPAIGDVVEAYKFIADVPQIESGTGSGFLKATIPLLSIGIARLQITLT